MDPAGRMTCDELLDHSYYDHFRDWFKPELEMLLAKDAKKIAKSKSRMHVCIVVQLLCIQTLSIEMLTQTCIGIHTVHTHAHTHSSDLLVD